MSQDNSNMIISIAEAGPAAARVFKFKIWAEGQLLAENALSVVESQEVREVSRQYSSLFEKGCKADAARDYFGVLGQSLFHLFLEKAWDIIEPRTNRISGLLIASDIPEALQLPWELLSLKSSDRGAIGFYPGFAIRRFPVASDAFPSFSGELHLPLPPGPMKALFMACEPLDYEGEERSILRAMDGRDIAFEVCDSGSFEELLIRAKSFQPHLVHLVGLGKIMNGRAHFSFQADNGRPDLRSAEEMGKALSKIGISCMVLGGCQREMPQSLDMICQGLTDHIPLAVAWNASADSSRDFYSAIASGTLDDAVGRARTVAKPCTDGGQGKICGFPVLYSKTDQNRLFDPGKAGIAASRHWDEQHPLPGMTEGYAEDFVDRRQDLQRLTSALREGTARTVIITGPNGAGKTALAVHLALRLASEGYSIMHVYSSAYNSISATRLLEAAIGFLATCGRRDEAERLRDPAIQPLERLKSMLDVLERGRIVMLLDGMDLDDKTGKIKDAELSEFYLHMLREMDRMRAIITARALPADALTLPKKAWEWPLLGISEASFIKYMLGDERIASAYRRGDIGYDRLQRLHGSTAPSACLPQIRRAVMMAEEGLSLCDEFLARLYSSLKPDSRLSLSSAAVYGTAVNPSGLADAAGISEESAISFAGEWQEMSMVHPVSSDPSGKGGLLAVSSQARPFLLKALSPDQLNGSHRRAGDFLRGMAEAGRSAELGLSRLDCLLEARGQYIAAEEPEQARSVTASISGYLERRGYYSLIIRLNEELLSTEMHIGPMDWIARSYLDQGKYLQAQRWYSQTLDVEQSAAACRGLGTVSFRQGKYDLARENFQKAAEICRLSGDTGGEAAVLHGLASIDMEQKREKDALEKLQRVAEIQEQMGDRKGLAATLHDMATIDLRLGNYDAARQRLGMSLEIVQSTGDKGIESGILFNLASLDMEKGDFEAARKEFQNALSLKREMGDRRSEASILHSLGAIDMQSGEMDRARRSFMDALRIFQDLGDKSGEAGAFFQLGAIAIQQNRIPEGLRLMALSAVVLRSIGSEEVKEVEPVVERLASQLKYSQEQFLEVVREAVGAYRRDRGWGLVEAAFGK